MSEILLSLFHHLDVNWEEELEHKREQRKKLQSISDDLSEIYNAVLSELKSDIPGTRRRNNAQ